MDDIYQWTWFNQVKVTKLYEYNDNGDGSDNSRNGYFENSQSFYEVQNLPYGYKNDVEKSRQLQVVLYL